MINPHAYRTLHYENGSRMENSMDLRDSCDPPSQGFCHPNRMGRRPRNGASDKAVGASGRSLLRCRRPFPSDTHGRWQTVQCWTHRMFYKQKSEVKVSFSRNRNYMLLSKNRTIKKISASDRRVGLPATIRRPGGGARAATSSRPSHDVASAV